ncbi:hypothetical protein N7539_000688 [Penicillium diatomitis]|uniref:Uncharacterized protein n=1 Tax=Penicillium diatomitis TaxID=2819901 RepID=A0A9W9XM54_9EURO|nr:uncharacterized protein N7539_000688 [Penicillium diatomitis]KAJ5495572.1 hypothetical protein N7539_000688 [Penicillium diatomitis]
MVDENALSGAATDAFQQIIVSSTSIDKNAGKYKVQQSRRQQREGTEKGMKVAKRFKKTKSVPKNMVACRHFSTAKME